MRKLPFPLIAIVAAAAAIVVVVVVLYLRARIYAEPHKTEQDFLYSCTWLQLLARRVEKHGLSIFKDSVPCGAVFLQTLKHNLLASGCLFFHSMTDLFTFYSQYMSFVLLFLKVPQSAFFRLIYDIESFVEELLCRSQLKLRVTKGTIACQDLDNRWRCYRRRGFTITEFELMSFPLPSA